MCQLYLYHIIIIIIIIIIMSFTANIDNENGEINDKMIGWQTTLVVQE